MYGTFCRLFFWVPLDISPYFDLIQVLYSFLGKVLVMLTGLFLSCESGLNLTEHKVENTTWRPFAPAQKRFLVSFSAKISRKYIDITGSKETIPTIWYLINPLLNIQTWTIRKQGDVWIQSDRNFSSATKLKNCTQYTRPPNAEFTGDERKTDRPFRADVYQHLKQQQQIKTIK